MYEPSFKIFCTEVVEKRIIDGQEVMRITTLRNRFVKIIEDTENMDASTYKNITLKRRLQKKCGDGLAFIRPHFHMCELV